MLSITGLQIEFGQIDRDAKVRKTKALEFPAIHLPLRQISTQDYVRSIERGP